MINTKFSMLFLLLLIVYSCDNSTSPSDSQKKLTDYSRQYKMIFRFDNNIYSINSDGSELTQLTNFDCHIQDITINNENTIIAFVATINGPMEIFIIPMVLLNTQHKTTLSRVLCLHLFLF